MGFTDRYLRHLGVERAKPGYGYLRRLISAHQRAVPYENVSKLARFGALGPSIPSIEEHLEGMERSGFGGTCFTQNGYFSELLRGLGFESDLMAVDSGEGSENHLSCRVKLPEGAFVVDLGLCSPFSGPFSLDAGMKSYADFGGLHHLYECDPDGETYTMLLRRESGRERQHRGRAESRDLASFASSIRQTFDRDALFMTVLCAFRVFEDRAVVVWNRELSVIRGSDAEKRPIASLGELRAVFRDDLALPDYPLEQALESLRAVSGQALF